MKKILLLALILLATASWSLAQDVEEIQQTLITKRTATWCPLCGSWGWSFFEELIEDNSEKAVYMSMHIDGSILANPTSLTLAANFGGLGQPKFIIDNTIAPVSSSTTGTYRGIIQDTVDANYLKAPLANTGIDIVHQNGILNINSKVRFFQAATGEYYTGLYFVEDKVMEEQASISGIAEHKMVLRESLFDDPFGDFMFSGSVPAGNEFTPVLEVPLPGAYALENLYIMGIVWRKDGDIYQVVNTMLEKVPEEVINNTLEAPLQAAQVRISPNPVISTAIVELKLKEATEANIQLMDMHGHTIATLFSGMLHEGMQSLEIDRAAYNVPAGLYLLQVNTDQGQSMERLVFQ